MRLYHYTCEHGAERIEYLSNGMVIPQRQPVLGDLHLSWFTSMPSAGREALGLTSKSLSCDRMEALFEVEPDDVGAAITWAEFKTQEAFAPLVAAGRSLEAVRGTRPALWLVAAQPVRARRVR